MIVHKVTMGIVEHVWTGKYAKPTVGPKVPLLVEATLQSCNIPESEYDLWWYVPNGSSLAKKLRRCYPDCIPVVNDEGYLIDVKSDLDIDVVEECLDELKEDEFDKPTSRKRHKNISFPGLEDIILDKDKR